VTGADRVDDAPTSIEVKADELEHRSTVLERLAAQLVGGNETVLTGVVDMRAQSIRIAAGERGELIGR
jgi:hypothetical protein